MKQAFAYKSDFIIGEKYHITFDKKLCLEKNPYDRECKEWIKQNFTDIDLDTIEMTGQFANFVVTRSDDDDDYFYSTFQNSMKKLMRAYDSGAEWVIIDFLFDNIKFCHNKKNKKSYGGELVVVGKILNYFKFYVSD